MFWVGYVKGSQKFWRTRHWVTCTETGFTWQKRQVASWIQEGALNDNQQGTWSQRATVAWIWIPPIGSSFPNQTMWVLSLVNMFISAPQDSKGNHSCATWTQTPKPQAKNAETLLLLNLDETVKSYVQDYPGWQRPKEKALIWDTVLREWLRLTF